jgi:hypothetical protein
MTMRGCMKLSFAIAAILFSHAAAAAEQWGSGNLKRVYTMADGSFVIMLQTDPPACPAPSSPKYLWVTPGQNGVTADGLKALLATSLAAIAAGRPIEVAFSDSTTSCYVNRLLITD